MNILTRSTILVICLGVCVGGLIFVRYGTTDIARTQAEWLATIDPQTDYEFASIDLHTFSFAQLEAVVRADAAARFPNTRVELGSVRAEPGMLTMTVIFFGANRQAQAFLYGLVAEKNSWKITSARRLWFVAPSQIARGLRV